jgi:hypothetical protein
LPLPQGKGQRPREGKPNPREPKARAALAGLSPGPLSANSQSPKHPHHYPNKGAARP